MQRRRNIDRTAFLDDDACRIDKEKSLIADLRQQGSRNSADLTAGDARDDIVDAFVASECHLLVHCNRKPVKAVKEVIAHTGP